MDKRTYEDCIFCTIASIDEKMLPEYDRPIIQTADFFVIPALGQFTEGYVLICPKVHLFNMSIMEPKLFSQFLNLKEQVRTLLFEVYGRKPAFFEHGMASNWKRGGSCVEHAHIHAIPTDLLTPPTCVSENLEGGRIDDINAVVEYAKLGKPYFFLECPNGTMYLYDANILPCQYGRKIFASEIGIIDEWDWHYYPFKKKMIETSCALKNRMKRKP